MHEKDSPWLKKASPLAAVSGRHSLLHFWNFSMAGQGAESQPQARTTKPKRANGEQRWIPRKIRGGSTVTGVLANGIHRNARIKMEPCKRWVSMTKTSTSRTTSLSEPLRLHPNNKCSCSPAWKEKTRYRVSNSVNNHAPFISFP